MQGRFFPDDGSRVGTERRAAMIHRRESTGSMTSSISKWEAVLMALPRSYMRSITTLPDTPALDRPAGRCIVVTVGNPADAAHQVMTHTMSGGEPMALRSIALVAMVALLVVAFAAPGRASAYSPYDPRRCFAADNNINGRIGVIDYQRAAYHYGAVLGWPGANGYDPQFDIFPFPMGDNSIDIRDIQAILGRYGGTCSVTKKAAAYFDLGSPGWFYNDVIATGYESAYYGPSQFGMRVLDANVARSQGVELCVALDLTSTLLVIWDESAPYGPAATQVSPNMLMASGPYQTGASVCLGYISSTDSRGRIGRTRRIHC